MGKAVDKLKSLSEGTLLPLSIVAALVVVAFWVGHDRGSVGADGSETKLRSERNEARIMALELKYVELSKDLQYAVAGISRLEQHFGTGPGKSAPGNHGIGG